MNSARSTCSPAPVGAGSPAAGRPGGGRPTPAPAGYGTCSPRWIWPPASCSTGSVTASAGRSSSGSCASSGPGSRPGGCSWCATTSPHTRNSRSKVRLKLSVVLGAESLVLVMVRWQVAARGCSAARGLPASARSSRSTSSAGRSARRRRAGWQVTDRRGSCRGVDVELLAGDQRLEHGSIGEHAGRSRPASCPDSRELSLGVRQ